MNFPKYLPAFCLLFVTTSTLQAQPIRGEPSLADLYADSFKIGVALNAREIRGSNPQASRLIGAHFNALTAENEMKWERIHPAEGEFNFDVADALVERAEAQGAFTVGHTLLWHNQTPDWVFEDSEGHTASRVLLLNRLKHHIETVVGRYKGRIDGWDVVNEAFNEDGTWRESPWYKIIGPDYIAKAFEYTHAVDPDAALYYNDYNLYKPAKRAAAIALIKDLQSQGIPVGGIGIQGHYGLGYPPLDELETSIVTFGELGIPVMFTELYPFRTKVKWGRTSPKTLPCKPNLIPMSPACRPRSNKNSPTPTSPCSGSSSNTVS